ncbi:hypothetical protein QP185_19680 [Sphingomonas aerolata]|uniref:hypothetical protein n=1 Tax=Sphingomonas aerolata TaxID=185951 RepID=UPI002FE352D2
MSSVVVSSSSVVRGAVAGSVSGKPDFGGEVCSFAGDETVWAMAGDPINAIESAEVESRKRLVELDNAGKTEFCITASLFVRFVPGFLLTCASF